jgi:hypothetical protein
LLHCTSGASQVKHVEVISLWRESGQKVDEAATLKYIGEFIVSMTVVLSR